LRKVAAAGAGAAGLALLGQKAARADVLPARQMWVHGHSAEAQTPQDTRLILRTGSGTYIEQVTGGGWFHFAIPTPSIIDGKRLRIDRVAVAFRTSGANAFVASVDVFHGPWAFIKHGFEIGPFGDHSGDDSLVVVSVPDQPEVSRPIGVTVRVEFRGTAGAPGAVEFYGVSADFV
jgi:hypothetical protein